MTILNYYKPQLGEDVETTIIRSLCKYLINKYNHSLQEGFGKGIAGTRKIATTFVIPTNQISILSDFIEECLCIVTIEYSTKTQVVYVREVMQFQLTEGNTSMSKQISFDFTGKRTDA